MVINLPYYPTDAEPKNTLVVPKGSFAILKTRLKLSSSIVPPDPDAFTVANIAVIKDWLGVTLNWGISILDGSDVADTKSSSSPDYVGGLAAGNTGLFAEGYPGTTTGRLALKIQVPSSATETILDATKQYTVYWTVKKNSVLVTDSETFEVGPAGVLVFGDDLVAIAMAKAGIVTVLTDQEVSDLITEASRWARGRLFTSGFNVDTDFATRGIDSSQVVTAIVLYTKGLIFERDASARRKTPMMAEGSKRIQFAGQSSKDAENLRDRAMEELKDFITIFGSRYRAKLTVSRRHYGSFPPTTEDGGFRS